MVMAVVFVTEAERRIPMQTPKRSRIGFKQQHYLPLKLNASGVIAIIFAQSLMIVPMVLAACRSMWWQKMMRLLHAGSFMYVTLDLFLIIFFSYFYTAVLFDPKEHAENFKQYGMFIPGIRPGNDTRDYLEAVMNRITLAGAVFIAIIAMVPQIIQIHDEGQQHDFRFLRRHGIVDRRRRGAGHGQPHRIAHADGALRRVHEGRREDQGPQRPQAVLPSWQSDAGSASDANTPGFSRRIDQSICQPRASKAAH